MPKVQIICEVCKEAFFTNLTPSRAKRGDGRFCSKRCSALITSENWRTPLHDRACKKCGKIFSRSSGKCNLRFYCSELCYRQDHRPINKTTRKSRKNTGPFRIRFVVLQRDNFTCQYCGRSAPEVILNVDHIYPSSLGGKTIIENLITSCRECNVGKSNVPLDSL